MDLAPNLRTPIRTPIKLLSNSYQTPITLLSFSYHDGSRYDVDIFSSTQYRISLGRIYNKSLGQPKCCQAQIHSSCMQSELSTAPKSVRLSPHLQSPCKSQHSMYTFGQTSRWIGVKIFLSLSSSAARRHLIAYLLQEVAIRFAYTFNLLLDLINCKNIICGIRIIYYGCI